MIGYGDRTWCEQSPAPNAEGWMENRTVCANEACPRRLSVEEGHLTCLNKILVAYVDFKGGEFCPGFAPMTVDVHT